MNSCPCGARNPLHCILPPAVLDHMLESEDAELRRIGRENLAAAAEMRAVRSVLPTFPPMSMGALSAAGKHREVYHMSNQPQYGLPGRLVRSEGQPPTNDEAVDEAYDFAGVTYDFYDSIFGRDSLNNNGLRLVSSVHVGRNFNNAFWNGAQMAYGDGDGRAFQRFTRSLDVVAHELTHGVVSYSAQLIYQDEPGALNEHFADAFGAMIKQHHFGQDVTRADWLVGQEVLASTTATRRALRSMSDPGTAYRNDPELGSDQQPAHYANRYRGAADYGGVHINSGIPNRAFYLAATSLGGNSWQTLGPIWYEVLTTRLVRSSDFGDMVRETESVAASRGPIYRQAVADAWRAVGL